MNENKLTQKSQEALAAAQTLAVEHGHQEVDGEHLLLALLQEPEGLVPRLLGKMDIPAPSLAGDIRDQLGRRPSVSTRGEAGKIYITQRLQQLMVRAEKEAKRLKDEYVSVEHLFLALLNESSESEAGRALGQAGIDRDKFRPRTTRC